MRHSNTALIAAAALASGVLTLIAYWPGLHGGFLFDDFGSLPALGAQGPVTRWPIFWRYITSGNADPTGRPLTLLTFLLDADNWPADPYPFKRTNLVIHLLNSTLLYWLLAVLSGHVTYDKQLARTAALLGASMWMLHPLLVSTTLYVVQREAMLSATCVMLGLLLWLHGRQQLTMCRVGAGVFWSMLGLGGFGLLAVLAKANGALLPVLALLIEVIVLAPRSPLPANAKRRYKITMLVLAIVPATMLLGYLTWTGLHGIIVGGTAGIRSWTYAQRLLTEPRVLMDYLHLLWLPRPFSSGLFNDHYAASTSFLHPSSTLLAMLAMFALIGGAWWQHRHHPALSLAVLFYFAGQLVESTSIPLELYFEHRNYLPALLMFWPLGLWLADARSLRMFKAALMVLIPLTLAWMTYTRAQVWGNPQAQAIIWARINPDSPRAQANAAEVEMQAGHPRDAVNRLIRTLATQPDQAQLVFNLIDARCVTGGISADDVAAGVRAMHGTANVGSLFVHWGESTLPLAISGHCPGLTPVVLLAFIDAGLKNPQLAAAGPQQDLIYLRGRIALAQQQPDEALADFTRALDLQVRPGMVLQGAATLGAAGYPAQGLRLMDYFGQVKRREMPPNSGMPKLHAWVLDRQHYWLHEFDHLRTTLIQQEKSAPATSRALSHTATPGKSG